MSRVSMKAGQVLQHFCHFGSFLAPSLLSVIGSDKHTHTHINESVCGNKSVAYVLLPDATLQVMNGQ